MIAHSLARIAQSARTVLLRMTGLEAAEDAAIPRDSDFARQNDIVLAQPRKILNAEPTHHQIKRRTLSTREYLA